MKKCLLSLPVLISALLFLTAFQVFAAETPSVYMDFRYSDEAGTIIEIPHIKGGGKAVESINARLDQIRDSYKKYIDPEESVFGWAEVLAYPCVTERYISIVVTCNKYPTYAYDGDIYTFVYDKTKKKELTLDDAMASSKYTNATFSNRFEAYIEEEVRQYPQPNPDVRIVSCVPSGFRVRENGMIDYYLRTEVDYRSDANLRRHYVFRNGLIYDRSDEGYPELRIKYSELEHMSPPLHAELQFTRTKR